MRFLLVIACLAFSLTGLSGTAAASATNYSITFTGSTRAISGSFTYDPAIGFSNFVVLWDGGSYDLTASANAPNLVGSNPCAGRASTPAYGFFIMEQSTTGCSPGMAYNWLGNNTGSSSEFRFRQLPPGGGSGDEIAQTSSFGDGFGVGNQGSYSIESTAPEPASWILVFSFGGVFAYRNRLRQVRVFRRKTIE